MIRPYVTVLKDSFHEAFASRVLWILLAVSTLLLCALVPLSLQEQRASQLRLDSIRDWPALIAHIRRDSDSSAPSPGKRLWTLVDDDFRKTITDATAKEGSPEVSPETISKLHDRLNKLLANREFYDKTAWAGVELDRKASDLIKKGIGSLSQPDLVFLNRQLFKAAFPAEVASVPDEELQLSYFGRSFGPPLPVSRKLAEPIINQILGQVMDFFVGAIAVFVAILVTAPIIPQTFEAGAIDLLLSKPVARSLLFLVKFFGGCAFILLNAGYVVVGLWAIMGLRFGLWNNALLVCIPLFLFLFVIYYSVSALAAVLWKNATVSIVITILFWAACFTVGTAKGVIEQVFVNPSRIVSVVPMGDGLMAVNQSGEFLQWQSGAWETALKANQGGGPPFAAGQALIAPVYDARRKQLLYLEHLRGRRRFGFFGAGDRLMTVAWSAGSWKRDLGPAPPSGASWLFLGPHDEITVVAAAGVFRLDDKTAPKGQQTKILGFTIPTGGDGPYVPLGPKPALALNTPFAAAMHPVSGDLVVYRSGTLSYLRREKDGTYRRGAERRLEGADELASLALAGTSIVVAQQDGRVLVLGSADLKTRNESRPAGKSEPYLAAATGNGRWFAVLFHSGKLVLLDADGNQAASLGNSVSAVAFEGNDNMLVADRGTRVTKYSLGVLGVVDRRQPALDMLQTTYRYFILPFYTIFPKPGELGNVVNYLLTDQKTVVPGESVATDLRQARVNIDIYGPIWSSLAFVAVMLGITCVYVCRMDI